MEVNNIEDLKKEVDALDLKINKDYKRFLEIDSYLREKYSYEIERGRTPNYDFIIEKKVKSFVNYPQCGFEMVGRIKEHYDNKYLGKIFNSFEEEQDMYNDMYSQIIIFKYGG